MTVSLADVRPVDYRQLMKKVEQVVGAIERADAVDATIQTVIESLITKFRDELGIYGGRLYKREGPFYLLLGSFGEAKEVPDGLRVARSYPPIGLVLDQGVVFLGAGDAGSDRSFEELLGVGVFAAIEVGEGQYILAFDVTPGFDRDSIVFSLGILRTSINQKIRQERMEGIFNEALKIQTSILPKRSPEFGPFEVYGRTDSMQKVGGDYYDYIPLTDKILGLAIADVSGHGLPAALQVRDIYTGLRMGLARDFKIVRTVERLNSIIHRSTLTSRFVSMFYGELERSGIFIYVNAGHPPPCHVAADGTVRPLVEGGAVLGPLESATYERGFVTVEPGDLLVFYTDGITEARGRERRGGGEIEEYGEERLLEVVRAHRHETAQRIVEAIFDSVRAFSGRRAPSDDRTAMVVKHAVD